MFPSIDLGLVSLAVFPLIIIAAVFICLSVFIRSSKYDTFFFVNVNRAMLYAMAFAIIGGKALFVLTQIGRQGLGMMEWLGGFVYFGGFIGAILGIAVYCYVCKDRFLDLCDVFTSLLPLGQAIGRIGCYCNGCCYGVQYDGAFSTPYVVQGQATRVFPTWFAESLFCLLLFLALFGISKRKPSGFYTAAYMIAYACFRFGIEFLRGDRIRGVWGGISTSQITSMGILLWGIGVAVYSCKRQNENIMIVERKQAHADQLFSGCL